MLRKNRLKCESISARLFLACHQKFNAFKCKQFCCAKPTLAHLLAGGFAPRPRERRAAVHSLCYSIGSSAHSPVNSLRSNSTGSCGLLCKPAPRSSQIACSTATRLLEACSSKFIKSLTLPCGKCPYSLFFVFCVFRKATSCRINLGRIIFDLHGSIYVIRCIFAGEQSCPCGVPLETAPQIIACPRRILPITSRKRVLF